MGIDLPWAVDAWIYADGHDDTDGEKYLKNLFYRTFILPFHPMAPF